MKNYQEYVEKMMRDGRFMTLSEDGVMTLMLFYSICDDPTPFLENSTFDYIPHDPNGKTVIFDNMICKKFKKAYAQQIEESICERYPQLEKALWIREKDRTNVIITHHRRNHAVQY